MKLRMGKSGYGSTIGLITQTLPFVNHRTPHDLPSHTTA